MKTAEKKKVEAVRCSRPDDVLMVDSLEVAKDLAENGLACNHDHIIIVGQARFVAKTSAALVGDIPTAYAIVRAKDGSLYHLLRMEIQGDRVVKVDKSPEDLRSILMAKMDNDIMADA